MKCIGESDNIMKILRSRMFKWFEHVYNVQTSGNNCQMCRAIRLRKINCGQDETPNHIPEQGGAKDAAKRKIAA